MKTAEEYFDEIFNDKLFNGSLTCELCIKTIKQVQIDAYNQALDDAVNSATAYATIEDSEMPVYLNNYDVKVNKDSILNLKK